MFGAPFHWVKRVTQNIKLIVILENKKSLSQLERVTYSSYNI